MNKRLTEVSVRKKKDQKDYPRGVIRLKRTPAIGAGKLISRHGAQQITNEKVK